MSNIGSYEDRLKNFNWQISKDELGYKDGAPLNIAYYCSDRNCERGLGNKIAMYWEDFSGNKAQFTYDDVRRYSNGYAKLLKNLGVKQGDRVCVYMDRIPDLYIGVLGILKNGSIVMPLFSAFREDSLLTRCDDAQPTAILTTEKLVKHFRKIKDRLPNLKYVIVATENESIKLAEGETAFCMTKHGEESFPIAQTNPESPSLLHYTSGTTGKPKGALHVHGSLVSQYLTSKWVLDLQPNDIYWCTADPGWVTGTSYGIIGPWSLGVTQVVLDGGFRPDKWYETIQNYKVTVWYSAPTAIRMLMKEGVEIVKKYDLSSLRHLCSVGEPLNPEAVVWSEQVYGLPFHDTYWQTETGAIMVSNYPGMKIKPGSMGKPFPGIEAVILSPKGDLIETPGSVGLLSFKPGWPSMMRQYWKNEETYKAKFKNGWYVSGDRARYDKDGYIWFVGRDDDIINTAGHLVSPFEVESALLEHEAVAESAAIGKPDPINMEVVKAFVALKPGFEPGDDMELSIINFVRKHLSPLAMPQEIEFVDSLPKTRSGKILRRVLRAKETGEPIGDLSTLEND